MRYLRNPIVRMAHDDDERDALDLDLSSLSDGTTVTLLAPAERGTGVSNLSYPLFFERRYSHNPCPLVLGQEGGSFRKVGDSPEGDHTG